ncbi:kielin/chordin-like protein [Palaemon carinicauda]|uniref:kielin/chordin-like protein n=1 Tax=Palaemon carinicauda TaxID=392227 RepID=UPI0035B606D2
MGGHTKNFLIAVTLLLYVTGTLARGVGEVAENTELEQVDAFEFTTLPYDSSIALEEEGVEDLEEERRKEEEEIRKKGEGCEYDGRWYETDEVVKTHEPCLRCKCLGATLVCQLRVCPQVPDIVPQGCYRLKKAGECCEEIVCEGELENNRLYRKDTQLEGVSDGPEAELETVHIKDPAAIASVFGTRRRGAQQNVTKPWLKGCVTEGAIFAEGSAMVSPDECSYCFCIRGKQRCVAPKCLLPVEGCRPRYRSFSCCPSYYDCCSTVYDICFVMKYKFNNANAKSTSPTPNKPQPAEPTVDDHLLILREKPEDMSLYDARPNRMPATFTR